MKCVVPGANVKILAKAVHALAKIGDEMYIEPQETAITFRTVNMSNSAYADFTFFQNYFSYYIYGDLQVADVLKCKVSMRSAMTVFKAMNVIDKQVETCHIRLEPDASEILFILKYKNSITKTHLLPILDCEMLQTNYDKDCALNQLSSQPRVLADAIQNFHQQLIEITLEVSLQKLLLRNYVDDTSGLSNTTRTQLALARGEFDRYSINSETSITFCLKEFKAVLAFAEIVNVPLSMYFEGPGKAVIFALKNPAFEANLVLSTLSADAETQTEVTLIGKQEKSAKRRTGKKRNSRKSNKSASKIEIRSIVANETLRNTSLQNTNPCSVVKEKEMEKDSSKVQTDVFLNESSANVRNKTAENVSNLLMEQYIQEDSQSCSSSSTDRAKRSIDRTKRSTDRSISGKKLVNSVFSSVTKRKSINNETDRHQCHENNESDNPEESVPNSPSPPIKKARLLFQKCFQRTFDPRTLPGYDIILAEDSDECSNE